MTQFNADGNDGQTFGSNIELRDGLDNARFQFGNLKKGNVAFLGGSITEMEGYRPRVCRLLQQRFLGTDFTFTNAGIGSTCSNTGAFRLENDILSRGPIDLLFVEFAVNDDQDGHCTREECIRGMEGIVRHARLQNPDIDIIMTFFVNEQIIESIHAGKNPLSIEAHESVAKLYGIPSVNVARGFTDEMGKGLMTWEQYGGVHPEAPGSDLCARMMAELFQRAWAKSPATALAKHPLPAALDPLSYAKGRFIDPRKAQIQSGWGYGVPDWEEEPKAGTRKQFQSVSMLCATEAGVELNLDFEGSAVGALVVSGPDSGVVEASVDGETPRLINLFTSFSSGLYYPWTVMLGTDLKPGRHSLVLKMSGKTEKTGHAMRIVQFTAN